MIDIKSENIILKKIKNISNAIIYSIKNKDEILLFNFNNVKIPFGLEKYYNDYILKIELDDVHLKIIDIIENKIKTLNKNKFKSQIKRNISGKPFLTIKIVNNKNDISVKNKDNNLLTIFDIKKNSIINLYFYMDIVWFGKDSIVAKFKTKKIFIIK